MPWTKLASLAFSIALLSGTLRVSGGEAKPDQQASDVANASVEAALRWLARHQEADGHWDAKKWGGSGNADAGCTGLACLAFLGAGNTEQKGPFADNVARALRWIVSQQGNSGLIGAGYEWPQWPEGKGSGQAHAVCAYALAECWGMSRNPITGPAAQRAVDYSFKTHQMPYSGFRGFEGKPPNLATTCWFVMQFKSAKSGSLKVPEGSFQGATAFVDNVVGKDGRGKDIPAQEMAATPAMTAVGMVCRLLMGTPNADPMLVKSADYLAENLPDWKAARASADLLPLADASYYYWWYGTMAMAQMGNRHWSLWATAVRPVLLDNQRKGGPKDGFAQDFDGSWDPQSKLDAGCGRVFTTALGALAVELLAKNKLMEPPMQEKAFRELAGKIEALANAGDFDAMDKLFDFDAVIERGAKDLGMSAQDKAEFKEGAGNLSLGGLMGKAMKAGGSCKFLRLRTANNEPRALFRTIAGPQGGLNYYELVMVADAAGKAKVCDVYLAVAGECVSDTIRRILLPAMAETNKDLLAKLANDDKEYLKNLPKLMAVQKLNGEGKTAEAMRSLLELPAAVQKNKSVLLQRASIASKLDLDRFASTVDEMRKALPNDPCLDMLAVLVFSKKEPGKAIATTERLETWTGGDPYLDVLRANLFFSQNTPQTLLNARMCLQKAITAEPNMTQARLLMLPVCLELKDYAEVTRNLAYLENELGAQLGDPTQNPAYAGFVQSEEYKKWQGARKPKLAPKEGPAK